MGRGIDIPAVGGQNTKDRGRYSMGKGVNIPWVEVSILQG